MNFQIKNKVEWEKYAGSLENKQSAVHNWYVYHHSYGNTLVSNILDELNLDSNATIFDPFCGCGTTLLVCQKKGIKSFGMDLMPLSILLSQAKTHNYKIGILKKTLKKIEISLGIINTYPKPDISIIRKAYSQKAWDQIQSTKEIIERCSSGNSRDFFLTALIAIVSKFGAYANDGAFPRLTSSPEFPSKFFKTIFLDNVKRMIKEIEYNINSKKIVPKIYIGDAREEQRDIHEIDAVICSPPYPNRHDYSRVYAVELGTVFFKSNDELKKLRRSLFRSHIEAKPDEDPSIIDEIESFLILSRILIKSSKPDQRVPAMLKAYFQDMEKTLRIIWKVLKTNGVAAIVVGNVRFSGVVVLVDELTVLLGKKIGFISPEIWVIRNRGNSPQQMRDYGKIASRESIIILRKG